MRNCSNTVCLTTFFFRLCSLLIRCTYCVSSARSWLNCLLIKAVVVIHLTPMSLLHAAALPDQLAFSHILPSQMEALGHVNGITEDRFGLIWVAGNSGLARYDGYNLKTYQHQPMHQHSLPHSVVTDVLATDDGELWVSTQMGLSLYREPTDDFSNYLPNKLIPNSDLNEILTLATADGGFWLGSRGGLLFFDRQKHTFKTFPLPSSDEFPDSLTIWAIDESEQGLLWLATQELGLVSFDPESMRYDSFPLASSGQAAGRDIRSVFFDKDGFVWAGSYTGIVYRVDPNSGAVKRFEPAPGERRDVVWSILQDRLGRIWIGDGGGLNLVLPEQNFLRRFAHDSFNSRSLGNFAVRELFQDSQGELWLGFFPAGVDRVDWAASIFSHYVHNPLVENSLTPGGVTAVEEDVRGNLWIGTGLGFTYFNRKTQLFQSLQEYTGSEDNVLGKTTISLLMDSNEELWVGSWSKGLNRVNLNTGRVHHYVDSAAEESSFFGLEPWDILEDSDGEIWVATDRGLNRFDRANDRFTLYPLEARPQQNLGYISAHALTEDNQGTLWVGTSAGLFRIDKTSNQVTLFQHNAGDSQSLSANFVRSLYVDKTGKLWVGTQDGGLNRFDANSGVFTHIKTGDDLEDASVTSIFEDPQGFIWFTTLQGAVRLSPSGDVRRFSTKNGLLDNLFNRNASKVLRSGEIFLGSSKGYSLFDPSQVVISQTPPRVVFTELSVFNKPVEPQLEGSPLKENILTTTNIVLGPDEGVFTLKFAALNYQRPEGNLFAAKLEGFDQDWHQLQHQPQVTYTNLDPGTYTLKVRAANSDGVWSEEGAKMSIHVLPPWYLSPGAYLIYFGLFLLAFLLAAVMQFKRVELVQQKRLNARLRKLDRIKDVFLANTSHELRTPLNGMIGIAETLLDGSEGALSLGVRTKLDMLRSSGKRLANLVNDILDYAKLTEHSLELRIQPVDLNAVLHDVIHLLRPLAEAKHLALSVSYQDSPPWIMADENRLQQILLNLIGNAIKFTDEGSVQVRVSRNPSDVRIVVQDTGIGIPSSAIHSVFVAFHQLDAKASRSDIGTGLGLAITKQLVEMQGGEIGVNSEFGEGSQFWFTLKRAAHGHKVATPKTQDALKGSLNASEDNVPHSDHHTHLTKLAPVVPLIESPETYRVMIVDDDPVNRMILRTLLEQQRYQVVEMGNGQQALDFIVDGGDSVHLILLDVMMPRVDGFQVCAEIRRRFTLHELPVLFLTAQKNDVDLQKGFAVGGNEFLTKPVSKFELLALVANHLRIVQMSTQLMGISNNAS